MFYFLILQDKYKLHRFFPPPAHIQKKLNFIFYNKWYAASCWFELYYTVVIAKPLNISYKTEQLSLKHDTLFILYREWSLVYFKPHVVYVCFSVHAGIGSEKFILSFCFCSGHPLLLCSVAMALPLFGEKILNRNIPVFGIIFVSVAYIPHIFPIMISLLLRNMICWIFRLNFFPYFFHLCFKISCPGLAWKCWGWLCLKYDT